MSARHGQASFQSANWCVSEHEDWEALRLVDGWLFVTSPHLPLVLDAYETQTGKHPAWLIARARMAKRSSRYPTLDPSRYPDCFGLDMHSRPNTQYWNTRI
jgi:hypothetical protein